MVIYRCILNEKVIFISFFMDCIETKMILVSNPLLYPPEFCTSMHPLKLYQIPLTIEADMYAMLIDMQRCA
jgi:hypothetical protein